jgi:6-pyruvoyltetrahydropterin/6-carboxytetrahydropterin synthase
MERYQVRVSGPELGFCSAHFIVFDSGECEALHGHNYQLSAEVAGKLGEAGYVYDFVLLRKILRQIAGGLDHRTLLPARSRSIRVEENGPRVRATCGGKEWVFPREDCVLLPVGSTTAEEIAAWVAVRFREEMARAGLEPPERLAIRVEEVPGMSAVYEDRRP